MRRALLATLAVVSIVFLLAEPAFAERPIMGRSKLTGDQLTAWFKAHKPGKPCFTNGKNVRDIAKHFVQEGDIEGVKGDIGFAQSIIETGYFRYGGAVDCTDNNYAGIGATDSGDPEAEFPYPRIGVRAQIQHLRRYADRHASEKNLHRPLVDPRFKLVTKGIAPNWNDLGNGNWATDPTYASKIINIYRDMKAFNGL
jgi:Mannosyl-glycoprotein endo-beta-N-acetylglucosaminidase